MTVLATFATNVHTRLADPSVAMRLERKALEEHNQVRRVVWLSKGGTLEQPSKQGGQLSGNVNNGQRAVIAAVRNETVHAYIYAETTDTLETLFHNVVAAIMLELGGRRRAGAYEFPTQRDGQAHNQRNECVVVQFTLSINIPEEIAQLVELDTLSHTCTLDP